MRLKNGPGMLGRYAGFGVADVHVWVGVVDRRAPRTRDLTGRSDPETRQALRNGRARPLQRKAMAPLAQGYRGPLAKGEGVIRAAFAMSSRNQSKNWRKRSSVK